MADFFIKKGDRLPKIRSRLKDASGTALDLTGATVQFRMKNVETAEVLTGSASVIGLATDGVVEYAWASGDTDDVGFYQAEWIVTYASGKLTIPNYTFITIQVKENLA